MLSYKCPKCGAPIQYKAGTDSVVCDYCQGISTVAELEEYAAKLEAEAAAKAAAKTEAKAAAKGVAKAGADQKKEAAKLEAAATAKADTQPPSDSPADFKDSDLKGGEQAEFPKVGSDVKVYRCQSCGAEIISDHGTAATICQYCHNPVILTDQLANEFRPREIIPFSFDKKKLKEVFKDKVANRFFVPKSFSADSQLDTIEGVYLPFWNYYARAQVAAAGVGDIEQTWYEGDYMVTETSHYAFNEAADLNLDNISCYASTKLPEESISSITPFNEAGSKAFAMPYLTGYRAENYQSDAKETKGKAEVQVQEEMQKIMADFTKGLTRVKYSQRDSRYELDEDPDLVLKPVYVMTYKYMRKVYIFTVNGQTMKMYGEIPLDKPKLTLVTLLVALLVFLLSLGVCYFIGQPGQMLKVMHLPLSAVQAISEVESATPSEAANGEANETPNAAALIDATPSEAASGPLLARPKSYQASRGRSRSKSDWEHLPDVASRSGPPTGAWDGTNPIEMERIEDLGGLFSETEKEALNERLNDLSKKYYTDFILLTTTNNKYKDPVKYTEHYYREHFDKDQDNIILLIDMDLRQYRQTFKGISLWYFEDSRQQEIVQTVLPFLKNADYVGAVNAALDGMAKDFEAGASTYELLSIEKGQGKVDKYTAKEFQRISPKEMLISFCISIFAALLFHLAIQRSYHPKAQKLIYEPSGTSSVVQRGTPRKLIGRDVRRVQRPKSSSGGSGGGASTGGSSTFSSGGSTSSSSGGGF